MLCRAWKVDQDHDRVYAFCTTEPNPLVAPKHPKAMPVILLAEDQERWLTPRSRTRSACWRPILHS